MCSGGIDGAPTSCLATATLYQIKVVPSSIQNGGRWDVEECIEKTKDGNEGDDLSLHESSEESCCDGEKEQCVDWC